MKKTNGLSKPLFVLFIAFFVTFNLGISPAMATVDMPSGVAIKNTDFLTLGHGLSSTFKVTYKNSGKTTWKKGIVFLETGDFLKSFSKLKNNNWLTYYRPIGLSTDVKPGQSVTLSVPITAPSDVTGDIQQNFQLVENGERPIKGTTLRMFVTVKQVTAVAKATTSTASTVVASTPVPVSVPVAIAQVTQNSSYQTTTKTNLSSFSCSATGIFTTEQISQYANCNTAAKENDTTNGQSNSTAINQLEPMMRVGLFSTTLAQRIVQTSPSDVYADNAPLFSGVNTGEVITLGFNFTTYQYSATVAGMTKYSMAPIRVVPRTKNSPATLLDYRTTPTGSGTVSDNRFRNIIEMQYSVKTCKLWLINELPLTYYLKGLGETSNYSPVEFQKVMLSAARTYAMYHYNRGIDYKVKDGSTKHADEHFHVDATYDQVYRGYSSELRIPTLVQAENETKGLVITYQGKVVVTPYFSRSDGRTRSWTEVWGGAGMPWLQSVTVAQDNGQTLWGHGVGMSARGALLMVVNEKKSWDTVIKYFYQGTEIQKIY